MHRRIVFFFLAVFLLPICARAEVVRLKDGTKIDGSIGAWNADGTEFYFDPRGDDENDSGKPRWIKMSDVKGIRYDGGRSVAAMGRPEERGNRRPGESSGGCIISTSRRPGSFD